MKSPEVDTSNSTKPLLVPYNLIGLALPDTVNRLGGESVPIPKLLVI